MADRSISERVNSLFDAIAHGDEEHRQWLKEAIALHFEGKPVPAPRPSRASEAELVAALRLALDAMEITEKMRRPDWDGKAAPDSAVGKARALLSKHGV